MKRFALHGGHYLLIKSYWHSKNRFSAPFYYIKVKTSDIYRLLNSRKIRALKNALGLPGQYHIWRGY